jgi:hypothetical protein
LYCAKFAVGSKSDFTAAGGQFAGIGDTGRSTSARAPFMGFLLAFLWGIIFSQSDESGWMTAGINRSALI